MFSICGVKVVHFECEMDFIIAEVVRTFHVPEPCELKKVRCDTVAKVYKFEAAVVGILCAGYGKTASHPEKENREK